MGIIHSELEKDFQTADINTIISIIKKQKPQHVTPFRFITLKAPFAKAIANPSMRREIVRTQDQLWREGVKGNQYKGDKWGGKYLRAPDIFFTVLEKGRNILVPLKDIANIRRGITTGANDFFFLGNEQIIEWGIEDDFLQKSVKNGRELDSIYVDINQLTLSLFLCNRPKSALNGTNALEYIKWGESQKLHKRPTLSSRKRWWDLGQRPMATINVNYLVNDVLRFYANNQGFIVSDNFQEIHVKDNWFWQLVVSTNSIITQLFANVVGRANFGGGLMKIQTYELADLLVVHPDMLSLEQCKKQVDGIGRLSLAQADRLEFDNFVFDALELTLDERDAVYEAVQNLVENRLTKAKSK